MLRSAKSFRDKVLMYGPQICKHNFGVEIDDLKLKVSIKQQVPSCIFRTSRFPITWKYVKQICLLDVAFYFLSPKVQICINKMRLSQS